MADWWHAARANRLFLITLGLALIVVGLDQVSKLFILHGLDLPNHVATLDDGRIWRGHYEISGIFDLTYVENRGVSFGLFAGGMVSRVGLSLLALLVSGFVLRWAGRLDRKIAAIGAGMIVGGALGNAIDRILYGYVVDFLDFSGMMFPWQFNVADAAINVGVAFLAYDAFIVMPKREAAQAALANEASETAETALSSKFSGQSTSLSAPAEQKMTAEDEQRPSHAAENSKVTNSKDG